MTPTSPRTRWLGLARTAVLTVLAVYVGLGALLYFRQEQMIFPGAATQGTSEAGFPVPENAELVRLSTVRGVEIAALWSPARGGAPAPGNQRVTFLLFYGNGMSLADSLTMVSNLRALNMDVLAVEYPGYGLSAGRPSEAGFYAAADSAYDYLTGARKVNPEKVVVLGRSLGGAVALDLAARRPVGGVVTLSTFTSIADVAAPQFPLFPVRALLRHRFDSRRKVSQIHGPILLIHGTDDAVIPIRMRDELAAAAVGPVSRYDVAGAGHNNLFARDREGVLRAIREFIRASENGSSR